ncbi:MAG: ankyrin repeat domain-containing protein [Phycisphaerae bacterium]|nr:ankyrin repeat domain-containing protein [Phycisphaerae bacterium]
MNIKIFFYCLTLFLLTGCYNPSNSYRIQPAENNLIASLPDIVRLEKAEQAKLIKQTIDNDWQALMQKILEIDPNLASILFNEDNNMTLHYVKSAKMAELLIKNGASVNSINIFGATPLHYAHNTDIANVFVENGANVNVSNNGSETPLQIAAYIHDAPLGLYLLSKGADPKIEDGDGRTALFYFYATDTNWDAWPHFNGNKKLVEFHQRLVDGIDVNIKDNKGNTALHLAPTPDIVKLLLEKGAKVNTVNNDGFTPLHWANDIDSVQAMVEKGADINAHACGTTPLHLAVQCHNESSVLYLLSKGANANAKDSYGRTPLLVFYDNKWGGRLGWPNQGKQGSIYNLLKKLVEVTNVNITDDEGQTALHLTAKSYDQYFLVSELIKKGAKVNIQDKKGQTPAHLATRYGYLHNLEKLVNAGADLTIKDNQGKTPIDILQEKYPFIIP